MRIVRTFCVAIAVAAAISGCGSEDQRGPSTPPPTTISTAPPTSTVATSPRGNAIKQPGETAYWDLASGAGSLSFVIDHLTVTPRCPGGDAPKNGANLTFDLQVTTPQAWSTDAGNIFHRSGYTVIGPDGVTVNDAWQGNTTSCDAFDGQWADPLAPASTYKGAVVLDVPPGSTILALNPAQIRVRGFEWPLPPTTATAPEPTSAAAVPPPSESPQERDRRIRQELIQRGCSTAGCIQTWFACRDGQQSGPDCDFYRRNPIS